MAGFLVDDGTLDTVIRCDHCGHEQRYNFDPSYLVDDSEEGAEEMEDDYDAFVDWCFEDFEESHLCEAGL